MAIFGLEKRWQFEQKKYEVGLSTRFLEPECLGLDSVPLITSDGTLGNHLHFLPSRSQIYNIEMIIVVATTVALLCN